MSKALTMETEATLVPKLHLLRMQPESNGSWCFETCQDMRRHASIDPLSISRKLMSSELYSGPSRALWELLQNADDCSYDQEAEMQIEQTGNYLWMLGSKKPSELLGMCWGLLIFLGSRSQDSPSVKACMSKQNEHLTSKTVVVVAVVAVVVVEIINTFSNPRKSREWML